MFKIKPILFFLIVLLFSANTQAQTCEGAVQDNAIVVSNTVELEDIADEAFWVCDGGRLDIAGTNCHIVVESGAEIILVGNDNTVYLLSNDNEDAINEITGHNNTFYIGAGAQMTLIGNNNLIHQQNGSQISVIGLLNVEEDCSLIEIDYDDAPDDGCIIPTNTSEINIEPLVNIFPNPVVNHITIQQQYSLFPIFISVYDSQGNHFQIIETATQNKEIDISTWPVGIYFLRIEKEEVTQILKVVKTSS